MASMLRSARDGRRLQGADRSNAPDRIRTCDLRFRRKPLNVLPFGSSKRNPRPADARCSADVALIFYGSAVAWPVGTSLSVPLSLPSTGRWRKAVSPALSQPWGRRRQLSARRRCCSSSISVVMWTSGKSLHTPALLALRACARLSMIRENERLAGRPNDRPGARPREAPAQLQ
jgi:hypothetical protein